MVNQWANRSGAPGLILVCGLVGTGKSTLAQAASELLDAPVVSSDRVRKQLAGLRPEQRAARNASGTRRTAGEKPPA